MSAPWSDAPWLIAALEARTPVMQLTLPVAVGARRPLVNYDYSISPLQHKVINAVEVSLAPWFTLPAPSGEAAGPAGGES